MSVDPAPPVLTIFAGPNGSGKTTLRNQFVADGYDLGDYINADDIQASWHILAPELSSRREREMWAFHEAERQRRACLTGGRDFSFETVFSHESKLDFMRDAKTAGYFIRLLFVATDSPRLNVARVAKRVKDGGHDIETDKVVNRYRRTLNLLPAGDGTGRPQCPVRQFSRDHARGRHDKTGRRQTDKLRRPTPAAQLGGNRTQ